MIQIKTQLRPTMHNRNPSPLHAAFSTASFSRNRPAAEEQFLEQNAWANSQHPVHQQLHHPLQRQGSQISSSLTTPAAQRRIVDLSAPKGSASTIADESSVPTSSAVATPISIAQHQGQQKLDRRGSTKPDSLSHSAEGVPSVQGIPLASEGERSPTDLRKHHPGGHAAERPGPSESPGFLQQSSAPVSSSSFPSAFGNSNPASRQGIFSEHLGMASPSSTSSAAKVEEVPENPRPPSAMSHLQHLQGSVITAGSGMGRFGVR